MNCRTFSTGCSSGDFGGKGYDGDVGWDDEHACHMRTGTVENEDGMSPPVPLGMRFHQGAIYITCVLQRGRTRPAPTPRSGQMAPNFEADFVRWSFSALGRVPRRAVISLNPSAVSSWLAVLKLALCDDVMRHLPAIRSQIIFFRRD